MEKYWIRKVEDANYGYRIYCKEDEKAEWEEITREPCLKMCYLFLKVVFRIRGNIAPVYNDNMELIMREEFYSG